jgi:hypothetical protein
VWASDIEQPLAACLFWVTRCLPGWVGAAAGLPQTAADLLRRRISAAAGHKQALRLAPLQPRFGPPEWNPEVQLPFELL